MDERKPLPRTSLDVMTATRGIHLSLWLRLLLLRRWLLRLLALYRCSML